MDWEESIMRPAVVDLDAIIEVKAEMGDVADWLDHHQTLPKTVAPKRARKSDVHEDAAIGAKIKAVLDCYRRWPSSKKKLTERRRAQLLFAELKNKVPFSDEVMRKILAGTYPPMKRLKIPKPIG